MNSKMTTNSQLSTTECKKQIRKQLEQKQNHRNGDHMAVISGKGEWGEWGKRYRE